MWTADWVVSSCCVAAGCLVVALSGRSDLITLLLSDAPLPTDAAQEVYGAPERKGKEVHLGS